MNDRLGDIGLSGDSSVPQWATAAGDDGGMSPPSTGPASTSKTNPFADDDGDGDIEFGEAKSGQQNAQPNYMASFFKDVDDIKADIESVRTATKRVGEINEEAVLATTTSKEDELSKQLKPLIDETNKRAKRTKNILALLKEENAKLKEEGSVKASDLR